MVLVTDTKQECIHNLTKSPCRSNHLSLNESSNLAQLQDNILHSHSVLQICMECIFAALSPLLWMWDPFVSVLCVSMFFADYTVCTICTGSDSCRCAVLGRRPGSGLTFSLGMVLDMSEGVIMAGTPPRKATAELTSLKLFFSFSRSSLNFTEGDSGPVQKTKWTVHKKYRVTSPSACKLLQKPLVKCQSRTLCHAEIIGIHSISDAPKLVLDIAIMSH